MNAAPRAAPALAETPHAREGTPAFEAELRELAGEARERRSVDSFARAALEGFAWAVLGGICGKLLWDSERPPLFFWPLAGLDLLLLWDASSAFRRGRVELRREVAVLDRVRELRVALGIDPAELRSGVLPALRGESSGDP
jgi:hypothetical protein